ncbi:MAG: hypothetical protein BJ554DRAFT_4409 [Olpidium bornovanus]|uniref:Uncharacterized protein n=1 Tax=Olpidium bornovanus TaxID=278681 RepID=A0A8H8DF89_9FUNG|nr:MAG: hypothetical protein BJ554DRAFT_4409 [Olpidium bornovanus]
MANVCFLARRVLFPSKRRAQTHIFGAVQRGKGGWDAARFTNQVFPHFCCTSADFLVVRFGRFTRRVSSIALRIYPSGLIGADWCFVTAPKFCASEKATMVSFQTIYDEVDYSGDEDDILKHILANNVVEDAPPFPPPKAPSTPVLVNNLEAKSSKAGAPALEPVGSEIAVAEKIDFLNADKRPFASNGRLAGCDENDSSFCAVMPPEKAPHDLELGTSVESHPCLDSGRSSRVPSGLSLTLESNREHPAFAALFAAVEMESGTYTSCRRGASTETSPKRASVSRDSRHPGQSRMRRPTRSSPLGSAADIMYSRRHQESRARQRYVYEGPSVRSGAISNCVHSERVSAPPVPWDVRPRHSVRNAALHEASLGQRRHSRETHRSNATLVGAKIVQNSSGLEPRSRLDVRPNSALDVTHGNFAFENRERSPTPRRQENSGSQRGGSPHGFDGSSVIGENWEFRAFNYSRGFVPDLRMSSATDRYYDTPSPVRDLRRRGQESSSRSTEESMGASRDHWRHINRHPDLEGNRWGKRRGSAIEVEKADSRSIHRLSTSRGGKFRDPIPMCVTRHCFVCCPSGAGHTAFQARPSRTSGTFGRRSARLTTTPRFDISLGMWKEILVSV